MYAILIISLLLVLGTLKTLQNRKTIIDKVKSETVDALEINNYQELLSEVENLKTRLTDLEDLNSQLTAKVNRKCVAKAYTSGSDTTFSFTGNEAKDINLTNIIKSDENCGITLQNGSIKIDETKVHTVLVTASVFFQSLTLKSGQTSLLAGVHLYSSSASICYVYLTPGRYTLQEIHTATTLFKVDSSNNIIRLLVSAPNGSAAAVRNNEFTTYVTVEVID